MTKKRFGEILVDSGLISGADLRQAMERQRLTGKRLGEALISLKIVSDFDIAKTLSEQLKLDYIELKPADVDLDAVAMIPHTVALKYNCIPIKRDAGYLTVAMVDPLDYNSMKDIGFHCNLEVKPVVSTRTEILEAIKYYYKLDDSIEDLLRSTINDTDFFEGENIEIGPLATDVPTLRTDDLKQKSQTAPIVRLFNLIFVKAMKDRASDIHLDPHKDKLSVRYRVDGVLITDRYLQREMQAALVSRIKILASLDISERRLPQDGAIRVKYNNRNIDLRVSTLPAHYGEKVVIRILDQSASPPGMEGIGLMGENLKKMSKFSEKRQGIILVTGPTGSGKSSTLYSFINQIRSEKLNIMTVEDPIEYDIEGLNQIQVKPEIGLTFANCLRSILRQDPNVIMLGEIRDLETAEIAFRAAMTGHLVISTVHTNSAVSTVTRLIDMGIPKYLVSSVIIGIVGQRLVRTICKRCRVEIAPALPSSEATDRKANKGEHLGSFRGEGCLSCNHTGFFGRIGIFEILPFEPNIREAIISGASEEDLRKAAEKQGYLTMGDDGLEKVRKGETTLEEVHRVIDAKEEMPLLCPGCQKVIHADFIVCPHCKCDIQLSCPACLKHLQPEWCACPYCGDDTHSALKRLTPPGSRSKRSKLANR